VTAELARVGGAAAALGLASLYLGPSRSWRVVGLAAWAAGCFALAAWLAPAGHHRVYAAAAVAAAVAAAGLAWLFVRVPWTLAIAVLACAPARIPVSVGSTKANLLLPLYLVVAAAAFALAWEFDGDDVRVRELGPLAWPFALFVGWTGVTFLWSADRRQGAIYLLFFVLPFGLLAESLARLPWRLGWLEALYVQLAAMALVFAVIGGVQYLTRDIFWNPKVIVDNAYAPVGWFYRVNSVFYDPSIYGRFLVVAILASLVLVLFGSRPVAWIALAVAVVTWIGLVPSFSQSSFVALAAGAVSALAVAWRRRAVVVLPIAAAAVAAVSVAAGGDFSRASGGRWKLVSNGSRIALDHPLVGVGAGGFARAYADRLKLKGREPRAAASHTTPVTVAAEGGVPGLVLFAWLVVALLGAAFRRARAPAQLAPAVALTAILVHSLFYDALFQDVLFWGLAAIVAIGARPDRP
jgi:putative inorganic carbon (hco3(-)) transporter